MSAGSDAKAVLAEALRRCPKTERGAMLRELLVLTAAGIVVVEGERAGAEAVYQLADAVVSRGGA